MSEGIEIRNNRVYLDGKATNEYVCPVCGDRIQEILEKQFGEYSEDGIAECCEWLYLSYYNDFGTVLRFSEYYGINVAIATRVINKGKAYNNR